MKRTGLRVLLATLAAVLSIAGTAWGEVIPVFSRAPLAANALTNERNPDISGELVAWEYQPTMGSYSSVAVRDLQTSATAYIGADDSYDQANPCVSLGRVAYEGETAGSSDIRVWDSRLSVDYPVANSGDEEVGPRIDGTLVIWHNETDDELWYRDLGRGLTAKVPGAIHLLDWDVDNGNIIWIESAIQTYIRTWNPVEGGDSRIVAQGSITSTPISVSIHGDRVAETLSYSGQTDVFIGNVRTTGFGNFDPTTGNQTRPAMFHDGMVWETDAVGNFDIKFGQQNIGYGEVASLLEEERDAAMFGRRIVYERTTSPLNLDVWMSTTTHHIARTEGADRYLTAIQTSKAYFAGADTAVLCTGRNFPDALSAGPLAKVLGGPLLLNSTADLAPETLNELARLRVQTVYLIGGPDVISPSVATELEDEGYDTLRVYGDDRYATSAAIAETMDTMLGGIYTVNKAFFARGDNFPDALALGPVAAGALSPILLVKTNEVPPVISSAVDEMGITSGAIAGGTDVVSPGVRDTLESLMVDNGADPHPLDRWSGATRYETALAVVDGGLEARWIDLDTLGVATGRNFPDALGAGAALGYYGSPLVLVDVAVPEQVGDWIEANRLGIGRANIFGGDDVVSGDVQYTLSAHLD